MFKDYSFFPLSNLILHYQDFKEKLVEKKQLGKQPTPTDKRTDQQIGNQIYARIFQLKQEQQPTGSKLFFKTIFPIRARVLIKPQKLEGVVIGQEEDEALIKLLHPLKNQTNVTSLKVPYYKLILKYAENNFGN